MKEDWLAEWVTKLLTHTVVARHNPETVLSTPVPQNPSQYDLS